MTSVTLQSTHILDELSSTQVSNPVDITIEDGVISSIYPHGTAPPKGEVIDGRNTLTVPGWINGHHHSHENFHKGRYDRLPLELWMNYVRPAKGLPLTPDDVYLRTLIGASQALLSGTTCIVDDLNASPVLNREHLDAVFKAYEDIGIRALVGPTLFDVPFYESVPFIKEECPASLLDTIKPPRATPINEYIKLLEDIVEERHPHKNRVGIILAPSAPQRCSEELLRQVRSFADEANLPVIIHVQETRLQASSSWHLLGKTLFQQLDEIGFLAPATSLIHAVWLTPDDISRIAASGASVQHNPNSNMKLGSGLMPMRHLLDAGVNISLGTDGCGSIESTDMLRVVSNTALVHKLRGNDYQNWIGADEAFYAGNHGGAKALGLEKQLGCIKPGFKADLASYRLDSPAMTPLNNGLRQLVFGESGIGLEMVMVDGKTVVKKGQLVNMSLEHISAKVQEALTRIEPHIADAEQLTDQLKPYYHRIWCRCNELPLAPNTIPTRLN